MDDKEIYLLEKEIEKTTPFITDRGIEFKNVIKKILVKKGRLRTDFVDNILNDNNLKLYELAFTFNSITCKKDPVSEKIKEDIDSPNNNEIFIKLGTSVYEYFIVWYIFRLFDFKSAKDVKLLARIRINYEIKIICENIAKNLDFFKFISSSLYDHNNKQKILLENTFIAFLGVTSYILDEEIKNGIGNSICYDILSNIFKDIKIEKPENINEIDNPITVLKNFFDKNDSKGYKLGKPVNIYTYNEEENIFKTEISLNSIIIGEGKGSYKQMAKNTASIKALEYLNNNKYINLKELSKKKLKKENGSKFYGDRTNLFEDFIKTILIKANIEEKYINILLKKENLDIFYKAFTSNSFNLDADMYIDENSDENYEIYETLGDVVFANFIYKYTITRFPELNKAKDKAVISSIKKKYGSEDIFSKISKNLGFLQFISSSMREHNQEINILGDTFESFFGAICFILDKEVIIGLGFAVCDTILSNIFDNIEIETNLYLLNTSVTNLKEIFDKNPLLGKFKYKFYQDSGLYYSGVYVDDNEFWKNNSLENKLLSKGSSNINEDNAKEKSAFNALLALEKIRIFHPLNIKN